MFKYIHVHSLVDLPLHTGIYLVPTVHNITIIKVSLISHSFPF